MNQDRLQFYVNVRDGGEAGAYRLECFDRSLSPSADEIYESGDVEELRSVAMEWLRNNNAMGLTQLNIMEIVDWVFESNDWAWFDQIHDQEQDVAKKVQRLADMVYNNEVFGIHQRHDRPNSYGNPERIVVHPCGESGESWQWDSVEGDTDNPKLVAHDGPFASLDDAWDGATTYANKIPMHSEVIVPQHYLTPTEDRAVCPDCADTLEYLPEFDNYICSGDTCKYSSE